MSEHAQESVDEPISTQNATQPDTDESTVHATQAALEAAVAEHKDQLLRVRADSENFKRRLQQDKETAVKFALESFIRDLIPILDGFDQAMAFANPSQDKESDGQTDQTSVVSGFVLIQQQILGLLEKSSVVPIQTDGAFDPHCHQAISQVASDTVPANHIVQVVQTGYAYYDRVVRPAMVIVSTGPDTKSAETSANQSEEKAVKKEKKEQ
ncbi:nucleotide exchange factor GrpE [Candidatus Marinamargulisbacteria bacterium]|nr:nucleotide exchange factor GrpE [Candidatus Marinamargulisbacteria bacterium]